MMNISTVISIVLHHTAVSTRTAGTVYDSDLASKRLLCDIRVGSDFEEGFPKTVIYSQDAQGGAVKHVLSRAVTGRRACCSRFLVGCVGIKYTIFICGVVRWVLERLHCTLATVVAPGGPSASQCAPRQAARVRRARLLRPRRRMVCRWKYSQTAPRVRRR